MLLVLLSRAFVFVSGAKTFGSDKTGRKAEALLGREILFVVCGFDTPERGGRSRIMDCGLASLDLFVGKLKSERAGGRGGLTVLEEAFFTKSD